MLLYALLHLSGLCLADGGAEEFPAAAQQDPGSSGVRLTPGVETTTGPLGQGFANAVGMALAEKLLAREFNREDHAIVDHHTYVFLGDGCMMEGVSHEAAALAGAWKLNKLVALYDDNGISIDGQVAPWFVDNTALRFVAYGWNVSARSTATMWPVSKAIADARRQGERPTLIMCKTRIGQGSPNRVNTAKAHGEPLGADEIQAHARSAGLVRAPVRGAAGPVCGMGCQGGRREPPKRSGSSVLPPTEGASGTRRRAGAPHARRPAQAALHRPPSTR
jgi:transketolase